MSAGAVLYVLDLERQSTFYERCLGLTVTASDATWRLLEAAGWELTLVAVPDEIASGIELADPPTRRADTPIKLAFAVTSHDEARELVVEFGGRIEDDVWRFRDLQALDCVDPEGNVVQLRERDERLDGRPTI